jgi:hypothetical protein
MQESLCINRQPAYFHALTLEQEGFEGRACSGQVGTDEIQYQRHDDEASRRTYFSDISVNSLWIREYQGTSGDAGNMYKDSHGEVEVNIGHEGVSRNSEMY